MAIVLLPILLSSFSRVHYMYIGTIFPYGALVFLLVPENGWRYPILDPEQAYK